MLLVTQPSPLSFLSDYSMISRGREDECDSKANTGVNDRTDSLSLQEPRLDLSFTKKAKSRRSFKRLQGLFGGLYGNQTKGKGKHGSASAPNTPADPTQTVDFAAMMSAANGVFDSGVSACLVSPLSSPCLSRRNLTAGGQTNTKKALGLKKKARSTKSVTSLWSPSPQGINNWCSLSGRTVELSDVELRDLCEAERVALQRVALEQLNTLSLGCHIQLPKDGSRRGLLKRGINLRRSFGLSSERDKKNKDVLLGAVFGQHLSKVLSHDRSIVDRRAKANAASAVHLSNQYLVLYANEGGLKNGMKQSTSLSAVTTQSGVGGTFLSSPSPPLEYSLDDQRFGGSDVTRNGDVFCMRDNAEDNNSLYSKYFGQDRANLESTTLHLNTFHSAMAAIAQAELVAGNLASTVDNSSSLKPQARKNSIPDVGLYPGVDDPDTFSAHDDKRSLYSPLPAQIPLIISRSLKFLEEHGLHTTGLFRVPGSRKRIRQMRDEFDCGNDVYFSDDLNPTDIGGLLKGFLRDLPEALLTKELYAPFIATRRLEDPRIRAMALNLLCALLPPANRDTLSELLQFLQLVSCHAHCLCGTGSADSSLEENGGNKMDKRNLATMVGPNILHKVKGSKEYQVLSQDQVDDQDEVISVVEEMIERSKELTTVSASLHDMVFRKLVETEPDAVDYLLKQKCQTFEERTSADPSMCDKRPCSRTQSDQSAFSSDQSAFHLCNEPYLSQNSSIVLCNPAARNSFGSLPRCGSEARDLDSLSSGYFSPLEPASPPSTSSALECGSTACNVFVDGGHLQWNHRRQLCHSVSSPSLEALRIASPSPSLTGSDIASISNKSSPRRSVGQLVSPQESALSSSPIRTVVTPATPDMPRRPSKSVSSLSSLVRMKGSLDLRDSNEELAATNMNSTNTSFEVQSGDKLVETEQKIGSWDNGTQNESPNSVASEHDPQQLQERDHNQVSIHHYPWQRKHSDWAEEIDLFQQETLV
ncbi:rho GTPase-activating protein 6-like isoform X2 [Corticium candelabrum]|uniref:rho GTPase-activating protein 6-like isoform X2 n=1 Tax=Corticium candelabrum TaxID=121492 RepID=UPI002E268693|nr:rho GTPase-activating protein 6-like isoform X2 [Corticium candelabrum]